MRPTTILLCQADNFNPNTRKWVYVTILRHNPAPSDFRTEQDARDWAVLLSKYSDHGRWRLGANSVTNLPDTAYSVGTSAPPDEKYWGYSPRRRELDFFERHTMTDGTIEEKVTVTLYEAWYGTNGLVPNTVVGQNNPMNGFVRIPSNILRPGLVRWERAVD
jgi:hypothetical protein